MLHLNAPDPAAALAPRGPSVLDAAGRALCARLLDHLAPGGVVVLELFNENALFDSLNVLDEILASRKGEREAHA